MRRLLVGLVVAAATVLAPICAWAGNQEVAERIAANLRQSGQLRDYKIGVKYQDGSVWLRGRVNNREQMNSALAVVSRTPGVTRVVNDLTLASEPEAGAARPAASSPMRPLQQVAGAVAPERLPRSVGASSRTATQAQQPQPYTTPGSPVRADRVATSFTPTPAQRVTAMAVRQPVYPQIQPASASQIVPQPAMAQSPMPQPTLAKPAMPQPGMPQPGMPQPAMPYPGMPYPGQLTMIPRVPMPMPVAYMQQGGAPMPIPAGNGGPMPQYVAPVGGGVPAARYDQPHLPNYAWPSYAAYPNYAALTYPKQYSPTAWPYIGPFYPYPQVPLGWRKVTLEWHDGWWQLDFDDGSRKGPLSGLFRPHK